jgi:hypothetical protein
VCNCSRIRLVVYAPSTAAMASKKRPSTTQPKTMLSFFQKMPKVSKVSDPEVQPAPEPSSVAENWDVVSCIPNLPTGTSLGTRLSDKILKMLKSTTGLFQSLVAAIAALSPHSMQVERMVSYYNIVKSPHRQSTSLSTINARLVIALNCPGTAFFDPREAVAEFFRLKERREARPSLELYRKREFVKNFFAESSLL